jgi:hypothetical protein
MAEEIETEDGGTVEVESGFANDDRAARPTGDGLPIGNELTPMIAASQVRLDPLGVALPELDDDAVATIVWYDFNYAMNWLDTNGWLAEFQYIDFMYQSPNYDRGWRGQGNRETRISRFIVAKNANTLSTQIRRGVFADGAPFELEATGIFAGLEDVETYLDAITQVFIVLDQRAELEYNMELFIDSQVLQGTAIAVPVWETKEVVCRTREPETPPIEVKLPTGETKKVHTLASDKYKTVEETYMESWPYFDFRRLGTSVYDPGWRTPNRPDLSAGYRVDYDRVTFGDLIELRKMDCYKDIPADEELKKYFLNNPQGDATQGTRTAEDMSTLNSAVLHAESESRDTSQNPFMRPLVMLTYWTKDWVYGLLIYPGGKKVIRNHKHDQGDYALGMSATWWNISNSGYGIGEGRVNSGDQRMEAGMLNMVLRMIGYWGNSPLVYNTADGNAPTQNIVAGLGTLLGVNGAPGADVSKLLRYLEKPEIPTDAYKIMDKALYGGAAAVGADQGVVQGNLGTPGSTAMRSAAGVNRFSAKADEQVATPIQHLEYVLVQWYRFLWKMVTEVMPVTEIRRILSQKYADAIIQLIDSKILLNATFDIKILAGQKLAARQAVAQIIPFLLQLVQQPQLLQYMHEKGWTINFLAIERIFLRVSELKGAEDIIVRLTAQEQQNVQQMNPNAMKAQLLQLVEKLRGENKLQAIQAKGAADTQKDVISKTVDKALEGTSGDTQLGNAEARLERNTDMAELQGGLGQ